MKIIRVGEAEIQRVEEMAHKWPMSALTEDESLLALNSHWLAPHFIDADGYWDMVFQSWVMVVDSRVIVVDPCAGNGRNFPAFPMFHMLDTPYIERFETTGFRPEDVDFVFCTHLHCDHCGWNTQLREGRFVPTFPNARYIIVKREYDHWDPQRPGHVPVELNAGVFENSVLPVVKAGLAEVVEDRYRLSESLMIEPAYGHTAGHSIMHLESRGEQAYFTGDAFHHPLELIYPELDQGAAEDFSQTLSTRRRLIQLFVENNALIIPAHFPAPHVGRLFADKRGMTFVPQFLQC